SFFAVVTVSGGNAWEIVRGFFRFGMVPQRADSIVAGRHFSLMERDGSTTYTLEGTVDGDLSEPNKVRLEILGLRVTNAGESKKYNPYFLPKELLKVESALKVRVRELVKPDAFYVSATRDNDRLIFQGSIRADGSWQATRIVLEHPNGVSHTFDRVEDL